MPGKRVLVGRPIAQTTEDSEPSDWSRFLGQRCSNVTSQGVASLNGPRETASQTYVTEVGSRHSPAVSPRFSGVGGDEPFAIACAARCCSQASIRPATAASKELLSDVPKTTERIVPVMPG